MERAVQIAYNRILGYFHGDQFYNLDELNEAIAGPEPRKVDTGM